MENIKEVIAILIGLSICSFASGVLFAPAGAVVFAEFVGTSVSESATGWFIFGAGIVTVVILNNVK